jgi:hypothetical protein
METVMDKYTDYLMVSFSLATVTTAEKLLGVSKDKLSRFLGGVILITKGEKRGGVKSHKALENQDLWKIVKSEIRIAENQEKAILIVDDTIIEKPYSEENDIICYHFDHKTGNSVKGINLLNGGLHYPNQDKYIPAFLEIVKKTVNYIDKDGKSKRKSEVVLFDIWFGSIDNFNFIHKHNQKYICPLKSNRKLALSFGEKKQEKWYKLQEISHLLETQSTLEIWLEGSTCTSYLTKQIFTNKDEVSTAMFMVTNDSNLDSTQIHTIYQKRWKVEEFHKSLKSNLALSKSPTKHKISQANHIFCNIISFFKLEVLIKATSFSNHYQFKSSLYLKALFSSYKELQVLKCCER